MNAIAPAKTLTPVRANAGTEDEYQRLIDKLIRKMNESVTYWLSAAFKANEPLIAQDELPSAALRRAMERLAGRWQDNFDKAAPELADYFAQAVSSRSDRQLEQILRRGGFSVRFRMTRTQRDILRATIDEQVNLIKSIPSQYFTEITGAVMRSVQTGGDLKSLTDFLENQYGVTRRRAAFIARDQNNKATANLNRGRQIELGITTAIWMHSGGGHTPRPTHVKAGREKQRYDIQKGWFDPDAHGKGKGDWILPGQLPNCRCVSKSVITGF